MNDRPPVRLELLGPHTRLLSDLCARCPHGPYGCCVSPPDLDWSDIGRIVALGGRDFLCAQLAAKNLVPVAHGLRIRRVRKREGRSLPREHKCVFHGPSGCTLPPERRPATCNYFLCEDALHAGGEENAGDRARARRAHELLKASYERHDREMGERIARTFGGPPWDAAFLDQLGAAFEELAGSSTDGIP
jgi:hypothetical protein